VFQSVGPFLRSLPARFREGVRQRGAGILFALFVEGLLALLLLTLAPSVAQKVVPMAVFRLDMIRDEEPESEAEAPATQSAAVQPPERKTPPKPVELPPIEIPVIQLSREEMAATDIANLPPPTAPAPRPMMGPPAPTYAGDSQRVDGTGPNGEPLYAASWYREPYDDELAGYLSTARGPGWGLIACRTVQDFRVEDCVALGEYPQGSNIARSVLAAAWQFRVRPPQIGGRAMVGEWVRIRIDYGLERRAARH
jgi:protein TonB